jgi:hypothetical protein
MLVATLAMATIYSLYMSQRQAEKLAEVRSVGTASLDSIVDSPEGPASLSVVKGSPICWSCGRTS